MPEEVETQCKFMDSKYLTGRGLSNARTSSGKENANQLRVCSATQRVRLPSGEGAVHRPGASWRRAPGKGRRETWAAGGEAARLSPKTLSSAAPSSSIRRGRTDRAERSDPSGTGSVGDLRHAGRFDLAGLGARVDRVAGARLRELTEFSASLEASERQLIDHWGLAYRADKDGQGKPETPDSRILLWQSTQNVPGRPAVAREDLEDARLMSREPDSSRRN